jgi:hydroxymethylbilane synthase
VISLRLGTRGSLLARAQSGLIAETLRARGAAVEIIEIKTTGDRLSELRQPIEGKGVFTKELDEALLGNTIDLAVHSMKDLPSEVTAGLTIAAVPPREDPRDVLITRSGKRLAELTRGARVGTGSPRRAGQIRALRSDVVCVEARGNVDTRIRKLREGAWEAIVLARAGLRRLGRDAEATQVFEPSEMIPAVGQGALAIVTRADAGIGLLRGLDDAQTRAAVECERAILARLQGGCRAPVAAHATVRGGAISVAAAVMSLDGATLIRADRSGRAADAAALGNEAAGELLERGAAEIVAAARAIA